MLGVLRYHLELDDDFHQLLGDADFDAFLAARVDELAKRDSQHDVGAVTDKLMRRRTRR
jgi:hypothetical protein